MISNMKELTNISLRGKSAGKHPMVKQNSDRDFTTAEIGKGMPKTTMNEKKLSQALAHNLPYDQQQ